MTSEIRDVIAEWEDLVSEYVGPVYEELGHTYSEYGSVAVVELSEWTSDDLELAIELLVAELLRRAHERIG